MLGGRALWSGCNLRVHALVLVVGRVRWRQISNLPVNQTAARVRRSHRCPASRHWATTSIALRRPFTPRITPDLAREATVRGASLVLGQGHPVDKVGSCLRMEGKGMSTRQPNEKGPLPRQFHFSHLYWWKWCSRCYRPQFDESRGHTHQTAQTSVGGSIS